MALFNRTAREAPPARSRDSQRADDALQAVRRRARQRFIGALVLVVAAIIGIPMLLDSDPRPLDPGIDVSIPSRQTPFEPQLAPSTTAPSTVAPITGPAPKTDAGKPDAGRDIAKVDTTRADAVKVEPPKSEPVTPIADAPRSDPPPRPVDVAKVETPKVETPRAEPPKAESQRTDVAKAETSKAEPARPTPAMTSDAAKAEALLEGKSVPVATHFYVQVGAFANVDGVHDLQARLKRGGVETYTEKLKSTKGERLRVRAGPYATRAEADQVLAKVKDAGVDGAAIVQ